MHRVMGNGRCVVKGWNSNVTLLKCKNVTCYFIIQYRYNGFYREWRYTFENKNVTAYSVDRYGYFEFLFHLLHFFWNLIYICILHIKRHGFIFPVRVFFKSVTNVAIIQNTFTGLDLNRYIFFVSKLQKCNREKKLLLVNA